MPEDKTIWSVGGGKGGIGKSIAAANIGCALAERKKRVMLVDADLGGANLHTYFGIKFPPRSLEDFLKGRIPSLNDAAIDTGVPGLSLISGAGEFLGIANPAFTQKQKLINNIRELDADYIIVDLGAGSSYNVLDFFALSTQGIVVLVPEPAAIQNAYVFLKSFVYRQLFRGFSGNDAVTAMIKEATDPRSPGSVKTFSDLCERISRMDVASAEAALGEVKRYRPRLLLNMAATPEDIKVADAFKAAAKTFLSLETDYIGAIYNSPAIKAAARRMRPFMLDETALEARKEMLSVVEALIRPPGEGAPQARTQGREAFGFNDNVGHAGTVFHVQTEVQGGPDPNVETVVYNGGRIYFSKKTAWREGEGQGLRDFATRQHRAAMAAIKAGRITTQG